MLFSEFIKILGQSHDCQIYILTFFSMTKQLKKQTFLQVSCRYAGGVKLLNTFDQTFHFFICRIYILPKSQVINNGSRFTSQVPVFINTADDLLRNFKTSVVQVQHTQLS